MMLYDAAFAVVARLLGADYRRAIIVVTLYGGLASTAFVPLTHFLVVSLGWRDALLALAAIQLPFCAGIPYLLLRGREIPLMRMQQDSNAGQPSRSSLPWRIPYSGCWC